MDRRQQPQWTISGIVESPVKAVWELLLENGFNLPETEKQAIKDYHELQPYTFKIGKPGSGVINYKIDKENHKISVQGEWWYRGTTDVKPHEKGSLVTYCIYNIAPGLGWWLAQYVQGRASAKGMISSFQKGLYQIGNKLDCPAYLIT